MAGLTGTFPFKPLLSRPKPPPLSLSPFTSKLFALRLSIPNFFTPSSQFSDAIRPTSASYRGPGGFSRSTESDIDDDEALDISTVRLPCYSDDDAALDIMSIRSDMVRLIDAQQNMVGVVLKSEAIQMAEVAELDLVWIFFLHLVIRAIVRSQNQP
ncbi:translation initiation factor IF3-4, chloroplastic-like isoform X2 [Actinidia eriantha]|uniref:translation initiation factor IF3-4, chloroplastic-like isoform X2 n=1 Tax=Actinidia eriantha TaxID=165200 RepID=UPI002585BBF8|nr:translation initiation factor IF3-4, chloroplastic-like isoform X2 [Actinidia eriantha]